MTAPAPDPREEYRDLVVAARRLAELEEGFGAEGMAIDRKRIADLRRRHAAARTAAAGAEREKKAAALAEMEQSLQDCRLCGLAAGRNKLVFGAGDPDADLMFVGEAPGRDEDIQGIPFVGRAGQLLNKIIEAIGLTRKDVYIGNVCKCRPPGNRTPAPDEAAACLRFLFKQIEIIRPSIIVTLGNPATQAILDTRQGITRLRGRFSEWKGVQVMPTFHPAYLLRSPDKKREVWEDMQKVWARMKELGCRIGELKGGRG